MMHVVYAMEPEALQRYIQVKQEIFDAKRTMTASDILSAKQQILASATINQIVEGESNVDSLFRIDADGTAHIPIVGFLTNSVDPCAAFSTESVTTYDFIIQTSLAADKNPSVKKIKYDVDTSGGLLDGVDVTSQVIKNISKPTIGVNHGKALSAGQWLISQTDEIEDATPTALSGSIGVAVESIDTTEADKRDGIKRRVFTSTDAPDKRLDLNTEEGEEKLIERLDAFHAVFVARVSEGRRKTVEFINENFGKGGVLISENALKVGMTDRIVGMTNAVIIPKKPPEKSTHKDQTTANAEQNNRRKTMSLQALLAENPAAKIEHDQLIIDVETKAEAKGVEKTRADSQKAIIVLAAGSPYDTPVKALAVKVLTGEASAIELSSVITIEDSRIEREKASAAQDESEETGNTPAQDTKLTGKADGTIETEGDLQAAAQATRARMGITAKAKVIT